MSKAYKPLPSQEQLQKVFTYDPETGLLQRRGWVGDCGWHEKSTGYLAVFACGKVYLQHRLIWMLQTGQDPAEKQIDHIDRDRANNRWDNLRLVTPSQNLLNTGARGWSLEPSGRYRVSFKRKHIGIFDTPEEASRAYQEAKRLSWVELTS